MDADPGKIIWIARQDNDRSLQDDRDEMYVDYARPQFMGDRPLCVGLL